MGEVPLVWAAGVLVKGTLLLLVVMLISWMLRRASAALRHLVWSAGIVSLLLLPFVSLTLPSLALPWRLPLAAGPVVPPPVPAPAAASAEVESAAGSAAQARAVPGSQVPASPAAVTGSGAGRRAIPAGTILSWLLWVWGVGAAALLARLALGAAVVRRIVRRAALLDSADWTRPLLEGADRLSLDAAPRLVVSDRLPMPFACGVLRPAIVLPEAAREWSDRRRRAVLCHELAHLRRLDLPVNVLGQLACALYWFHPLVWTAARRLRMESERACDDLVLGVGTRPSEYADHLLQIVCEAARARTPAVALPMAERGEFEGRMLAILERDARRDAPGRRQAATLAGLTLALLLPLAALGPATRPARQESGTAGLRRAGQQPDRPARNPSDRGGQGQLSPQPLAPHQQPPAQERLEPQEPQGPQGKPKPAKAQAKRAWRVATGQASADPKVVTALLGALGDSVAPVREDAAYALGGLEAQAAAAPLGAALARDGDAGVRKMIAWALGQIESNEATGPLGRAAQADASPEVREMAVWALGQIGDPEAIPALEAALKDQSADVRGQAAWATGTIEPSSAPAGLIAALKDSSPAVQVRAAWALGQIEDGAAVPALVPLLKDPAPEVRKAAFWAVGTIGGEAAQPVLIDALKDPDPDVRAAAARALAGGRQNPWPWPSPRPIIR